MQYELSSKTKLKVVLSIFQSCAAESHQFLRHLQSSQPYLLSASSGSHLPNLSPARRFWNVISRHLPISQECPSHIYSHSNSLLQPAVTTPKQPTPEGKVQAGEDDKEGEENDDFSANAPLDASKANEDKDEHPANSQNPLTSDPTPSAEDNRNLWKWLMRAQGKELTSAKMAPAMKRAEIVEVYDVRGFQRLVAMKRVHKKKPLAATSSALPAAAHPNGYSQVGTTYQGGPIQPGTSLYATSGPPSAPVLAGDGARYSQGAAGPSSHASPSHFVTYHTNHDSNSDSSIQGGCNKFLDKICFPRVHYHDDP